MTDIARMTDEEFRRWAVQRIQQLGGSVSPRKLARHIWRFRHVSSCHALLTTLVNAGVGHWIKTKAGPKGGRPSLMFKLNDGIGETTDASATNRETRGETDDE